MKSYDGKNVVITGGTQGFGLATARHLVDAGARVIATGRTPALVEKAQEQLGPHAIVVSSDTASADDRRALADLVKTEFGSLDLLFANAGIARHAPMAEMTEALYDELFAINTKGLYFTVQSLVPLMPAGSAVVLTTSAADVLGMPSTSVYAASKAAVRSMARTMAAELLPQGVRVNAVSPGPIDTGILRRSNPATVADGLEAEMREMIPMKRFGTPDEIVRAVLFLGFEATYNTGLELAVDGGGLQL